MAEVDAASGDAMHGLDALFKEAIGNVDDDYDFSKPLKANTQLQKVKQLPINRAQLNGRGPKLFEAVPAADREMVPYIARAKIERGVRQQLLNRLAGQYLVLCTRSSIELDAALAVVQRNEQLRSLALKAAILHENDVYLQTSDTRVYKTLASRQCASQEWLDRAENTAGKVTPSVPHQPTVRHGVNRADAGNVLPPTAVAHPFPAPLANAARPLRMVPQHSAPPAAGPTRAQPPNPPAATTQQPSVPRVSTPPAGTSAPNSSDQSSAEAVMSEDAIYKAVLRVTQKMAHPFLDMGTINRDQFKLIAQESAKRVMARHKEEKNTKFLMREDLKIAGYVQKYTEHIRKKELGGSTPASGVNSPAVGMGLVDTGGVDKLDRQGSIQSESAGGVGEAMLVERLPSVREEYPSDQDAEESVRKKRKAPPAAELVRPDDPCPRNQAAVSPQPQKKRQSAPSPSRHEDKATSPLQPSVPGSRMQDSRVGGGAALFGPCGRGRGSVLPAWITQGGMVPDDRGRGAAPGHSDGGGRHVVLNGGGGQHVVHNSSAVAVVAQPQRQKEKKKKKKKSKGKKKARDKSPRPDNGRRNNGHHNDGPRNKGSARRHDLPEQCPW